MHIHVYAYIYIHIHTYVYIYTYIYTCVRIHIHILLVLFLWTRLPNTTVSAWLDAEGLPVSSTHIIEPALTNKQPWGSWNATVFTPDEFLLWALVTPCWKTLVRTVWVYPFRSINLQISESRNLSRYLPSLSTPRIFMEIIFLLYIYIHTLLFLCIVLINITV